MGRFSRLGNDLFEGRRSINFVGRWRLWYAISGVILVISLAGLIGKGLNLGVEFEGGVEYRASVASADATQANVEKVTEALADSGIEGVTSPTVNTAPEAIQVTVETISNAEADTVGELIRTTLGIGEEDLAVSEVGASWGEEVANRAIQGLVIFLVLVVLFIWAYFREWKMSVAAIVALAHDVLITVGVYALSGFEVTPATVTGVLTILGFSLYDTVVVFDKVRENTKDMRRSRLTYGEQANLAVNQTLVRSINTSIVALLPVGALLYVGVVALGSGPLKDLALALFVGMAAGTYSSIFIATPLLAQLKAGEKDITDADRRARARVRRDVDRYANVPAFVEGIPLSDSDGAAELDDEDDEGDGADRSSGEPFRAPASTPTATGSGRVLPTSKAPVEESGSAHRPQPKRKPRSQR